MERVTSECADAIAEVIADDTGLPTEAVPAARGRAGRHGQVSARFWLAEGTVRIPQDQATELVTSLAWRGIRGFPRSADPG